MGYSGADYGYLGGPWMRISRLCFFSFAGVKSVFGIVSCMKSGSDQIQWHFYFFF